MTKTPDDAPSEPSATSVPPTAPPAGEPGDPGDRFFDALRGPGIVRPDGGRVVAGVAAGIAHRYGIDPLLVRIGFAALTLLGGLGITLYGLGWLFLPHPDGRIHAQEVLRGRVTAGFAGAALTLLLMAHHLLPMVLVGVVVHLVARTYRTHPHPAA